MLKTDKKCVQRKEIVNKIQLKKIIDVTSLSPEMKSYKTIRNKTQRRLHSKSLIKISTIKSKNKKEKKSLVFPRQTTIPHPDVLHNYLSYNEILKYLDYIQQQFKDFVKVHTIGRTFERRSIKCVEINWNKENQTPSTSVDCTEFKLLKFDSSEKVDRNIVFIEGGTHAREWISITVALNCIYQLTEKNFRHRSLLRKLKFYIVPLVNPDGYEYSRNVNPRWRKNRSPHAKNDFVGTDCNRNFDFQWNPNPSTAKRNTYQGDKPFSEQETKALAAILHSLSPRLLFFISLHSYAQTIMYPWGYSNLEANNATLMATVANAGRDAIKSFSGRNYKVGSISNITKRYIAGSVVDYAYGAVNIPITLVMELPANEYGFRPPVTKIYTLGIESWHGIREMCKKAYSLKAKIEQKEIETLQTFI